jgi:hypothetical protein
MRIFERNYYATFLEKIRAYTSSVGKILSSKEVAKVAIEVATVAVVVVAARVVTAVAAVAAVVGGMAGVAVAVERGGVEGGVAEAVGMVVIGVVKGVAAVGAVAGSVVFAGVRAVAAAAGSAVGKVAHLWGEKRRYLENRQENRALQSLARAVIREDLSFLSPTESFKAARLVYQSAGLEKTLRFSRALVEQLVRSPSPLAELQRLLPPHFEGKLNLLRENYNKLWKSEKSTFSLHSELSAIDGPSIALQDLVQGGRDLAEEVARNLSPQIVQILSLTQLY